MRVAREPRASREAACFQRALQVRPLEEWTEGPSRARAGPGQEQEQEHLAVAAPWTSCARRDRRRSPRLPPACRVRFEGRDAALRSLRSPRRASRDPVANSRGSALRARIHPRAFEARASRWREGPRSLRVRWADLRRRTSFRTAHRSGPPFESCARSAGSFASTCAPARLPASGRRCEHVLRILGGPRGRFCVLRTARHGKSWE